MGKISKGETSQQHKSIKVNLVYQIAYRVLTVITPLITSPYLARVLGVEALGQSSASQAYASIFMLFCLLGIENYGNREIAKVQSDRRERSKIFWSVYLIQFVFSIAAITAYVLFVYVVVDAKLKVLYALQGIWILSSLLDINWLFFGLEEFKVTVTRNIIIKIISIVAILLLVKSPSDLNIYVVIMSDGMLFSQLILWFLLPNYIDKVKLDFKSSKKHIQPILVLFVPVLALSIFHIMDKTMLNMLSDDANSGYYYNADKLVNIPLGMITALSTVLLPRITNTLHNEGDNHALILLNKSSELSLFLTCAIAFGIGSIADNLVPVFFGPGYEPCIVLLRWFIPVLIIKALSNFSRAQYLIPHSMDRIYTLAVISGAISNLIANYFLIRVYAALGAVIGTLVAETVVLVYQVFSVRNRINFLTMFARHSHYLVFSSLMYVSVRGTGYLLSSNQFIKLLIQIIVGVVVYMGLCLLYWNNNKNSVFYSYMHRIVERIRG